jgi:hypothetical protein
MPTETQKYNLYPLELVRGARFDATITLEDNGVPVNLTGITIKSQIKNQLGFLMGEFTITLGNQTTDPGVINLSAVPTEGAIAPGTYKSTIKGILWYDILLITPGGKKVAYYPSEVCLIEGVTNV